MPRPLPSDVVQAIAVAGAFALFAALATLVLGSVVRPLDAEALQWLQQARTGGLTRTLRGITYLGRGAIVGMLTAIAVVALWRGAARSAAFVAIAVGGAAFLNQLFKWMFARRRPGAVGPVLQVDGYAFPSGHATLTLALVLALWLVARSHGSRWQWPLALAGLVFVLAVGLSRPYLGVHYPSDVVAGWALATGWVLLVDRSYRRRPGRPYRRAAVD